MAVKKTHRRKSYRRKTYRRKTQHRRKTYRKKRVNSKRNKVGRKQTTYKKLKGGSIAVKQGGKSSRPTDSSRSARTSVAKTIASGYMQEDEVRKAEVSELQQSTSRDNPSSVSRKKSRKKSRKRESRPPVALSAWSAQPEPEPEPEPVSGCWRCIGQGGRESEKIIAAVEKKIKSIEKEVEGVKTKRNNILNGKHIRMESIPVIETDPSSSVQPVEKSYAEIESDQQRVKLMKKFSGIEASLFKLHVRAYVISNQIEKDEDLEYNHGLRIRQLIHSIKLTREINYIMETILQKKNLLINPEYAVAMLDRAGLSVDFVQFVLDTPLDTFKGGTTHALPPVKMGTVESPLTDAFSVAQRGAGNLSERKA